MALARTSAPVAHEECRLREVLDRVGDKWSVLVDLPAWGPHPTIHRAAAEHRGISQRMLTVTLRGLERDGLVTRTVHPVVPPRVEYALTPLGRTLMESVGPLMQWSLAHTADIAAARATYDARPAARVRGHGPMTDDARMPAIYLGHGAPPLLEDATWMAELADWSASLPRPTSILIVSAHWQTAPMAISATQPVPAGLRLLRLPRALLPDDLRRAGRARARREGARA